MKIYWLPSIIFICIAIVVNFLFCYNIICLNLYLEYYLHAFCQNEPKHLPNLLNLCGLLCNGSHNLKNNCQTYHLSKPIIFTSEVLNSAVQSKFVMKAVVEIESDEDSWIYVDANGTALHPGEDIFTDYLRNHIQFSVGRHFEAGYHQLEKLVPAGGSLEEYQHLIKFINDHEFLMAMLFKEFRIFPGVIGTCQNLYGVEFAPVVMSNLFLPLRRSYLKFEDAIKLAIELIKYVVKLDTAWIEVLHLCDVKYDHFGRSANREILFLDLDSVETDSSLSSILLNTNNCTSNTECEYFDCKSKCLVDGRCSMRTNTNLQVLCNKIFLGNSGSFPFQLYGLLNDQTTSAKLLKMLHKCANNYKFDIDDLITILELELKN